MTKRNTRKRLLSLLLTTAMLMGLIPMGIVTPTYAAETEGEKSPIDQGTFEELGFNVKDQFDEDSFIGPGNTTMNTKNELYLDYQAHKNYGWMLRENLNFNHSSWNGYDGIGAYKLYGQFNDGSKTDHLNEGNGYTYGQTGGESTVIGSGITSTGSHKSRAYKTAVEFRSSSGKKDMVAQLYVTSGSNRTDWIAKLELLKYTKSDDGKYTPSVTSTVTLGASRALDEQGMIFQQYFDALYDITAGDFDGDGIDEIAVYFGTNEVRIYDTGTYGTSLSWDDTITENEILRGVGGYYFTASYASDSEHPTSEGSTSSHKYVNRAAVVALTAGDLKKDFSDDLVVTVSMPLGANTEYHKSLPYTYIYGYNGIAGNSARDYLQKDCEIPLKTDDLNGDTSKPQVFKAANATIGDIDGDNCVELVIGGRLCDANDSNYGNTNWNMGALIPVEYVHGSKSYSVGAATQKELSEYDEGKVLINDGIDAQCLRYVAPVGMAVADLDGKGTGDAPYTFFFSELYTYDPGTRLFSDTGRHLDTIKNQTNNVDDGEEKGLHWVSDVIVGNFNNNDVGAEQIIAIVACKQSGNTSTDDDWYWYYMSYISKDISEGTIYAQCEGIINQGRSYINRSDKSRASVFVSVAAPDVDDDSILLKYLSSEMMYTKPEVQAILQSAPYFADVADTYDNYLNNGNTAYGKAEGSGEGVNASVEAKLGAYVDSEVQLGAAAEINAELLMTASYDHLTKTDVETSVEYAGAIGDDYVVMYTIPYMRYFYDATYPNGDTGIMKIEEPMTPATVIVPVDTYDAVAATTEGLEQIRGNILTSTPGDPSTYVSAPKGTWTAIGNVQALTNAGNSGSLVTVSQTVTDTKEHSFSIGMEESLHIGFGAGAAGNKVIAGISQGLAINAGGAYSNMEGVAYTGSVDNLPAGVVGYGFNWQLGISETELNGEDIIVVGYVTTNVKQAPAITRDLSITDIGSDYVVLEWSENKEAAMYELSISRSGNTWNPLKNISATAAVNGKVRYTVTGLNDDTIYYFKVGSSNAYGVRSLDSVPVSAVTLVGEDSSFAITGHPLNQSTHAGGNAAFSVSVQTSRNEDVHYRWEYNDGDGWFDAGGIGSTLNVSNVTKAMDGRAYRCHVSQVANYMYSQVAYLSVSKSETTTELTVKKDDTTITNGEILKATSTSLGAITETVRVWKEVVENGYRKLAETETTSGDAFSYSGLKIWEKSSGTAIEYYADNDGSPNEGSKYIIKNDIYTFVDSSDSGERYYTKNDVVTCDAIEIPLSYAVTANGSAESIITDKASVNGYHVKWNDANTKIYYAETIDNNDTPDVTSDDQTVRTYYVPTTLTWHQEDTNGNLLYFTTEGKTETTATVTTWPAIRQKAGYALATCEVGESYIEDNGEIYFIDAFVPEMREVEETIITGYNTVTTDGDKLTLTASVSPVVAQSAEFTGKASFRIEDLTNGIVINLPATAGSDGETWTAEYTFSEVGLYSIQAVYSGDQTYFASNSTSITVYVTANGSTMTIKGGTITYGESIHLDPRLVDSTGSTKIESGVTYSVTASGISVTGSGINASEVITGSIFKPKEAGSYIINASYTKDGTTYTALANVTVNKKTLTIQANDVSASVSETEDQRKAKLELGVGTEKSYVVSGLITGDSVTPTLTSEATTAATQGDYAITVSVSESDRTELEKKYSLVLLPGTYTLSLESVPVKVTAKTNGSVRISYTTTITDASGNGYTSTPLTVESGALIPIGAKVTITASPNAGFGVEKWVHTSGGAVFNNREISYTIDNLEEPQDITVYFVHSYHTLTFNGNGSGTVTGQYSGSSGSVFESGQNLNANQTVILTATPDENNVVSHWTKQMGSGEETTILTDSGENYTGNTVSVSGLSENAVYTAHFAAKTTTQVSIQFVDSADNHILTGNVGVIVNGEAITTTGDAFVIDTFIHDNMEIEISIPDSMLVDHWKLNGTEYADSTKNIVIEDLKSGMEFSVVCVAPSLRELTFRAELLGTNGGTIGEAGTIGAKRDGKDITFTNNEVTLPQGTVVDFTAAPNADYRIVKWTVDGVDANGTNVGTLQQILTANKEVVVYFEKLPTVSVNENVNGGSIDLIIDNDTTIDFASKVIPYDADAEIQVKPSLGYVIDSVAVNGTDTELHAPSGEATDMRYIELENVRTNQNIQVTYRALYHTSVTFSAIDKNYEVEGGLNGTITASVSRGGIAAYAVSNSLATLEKVYEDSIVAFTATPDVGYKVSKWFVNGVEVSEQPTLTITNGMDPQNVQVQFDLLGESVSYGFEGVTDKATISAIFAPNGSNEIQNFVSGSKPATDGKITVSVTDLDPNYEIAGWFVNGADQSADGSTFEYEAVAGVGAEITVKVIRCSYEVSFEATNGTITAKTSPAAINITSGDHIVGDTEVVFTALPQDDTGYTFQGWTVNGTASDVTAEALTLTITEAVNIEAAYKLDSVRYTVTFGAIGENGTLRMNNSTQSPAQINAGSDLRFTAVPAAGYRVEG